MGWTLVSTNSQGYRKYQTEDGSLRYMDSQGNFTSQQSWAGSFAQEGTTETPNYTREKRSTKVDTENRDDLGSYENATDYIWDEPHESDYRPPIDVPFSYGYPIGDYPVNKRVDDIRDKAKDLSGYDVYSVAVTSVVYDKDGTILSSGERHTTMASNINQIMAEFREIIGKLGAIAADYGGVLITETKLKARKYQ